MTKLAITILSTLLLSNVALAKPVTETNSLSKAALEINAMNAPQAIFSKVETPYTHESEKNNSLARAALAIQGVKVSLLITADSKISYTRDKYKSERYNSLSRGVLAQ